MCRTRTPSAASTTGSQGGVVARVKMSTSMPRPGQPPGQLDHVDVHPPGVTRARLVQRRGVQADHRQPPEPVPVAFTGPFRDSPPRPGLHWLSTWHALATSWAQQRAPPHQPPRVTCAAGLTAGVEPPGAGRRAYRRGRGSGVRAPGRWAGRHPQRPSGPSASGSAWGGARHRCRRGGACRSSRPGRLGRPAAASRPGWPRSSDHGVSTTTAPNAVDRAGRPGSSVPRTDHTSSGKATATRARSQNGALPTRSAPRPTSATRQAAPARPSRARRREAGCRGRAGRGRSGPPSEQPPTIPQAGAAMSSFMGS